MKKIIAVGDTHGKENWLDLPKSDILIHCGDMHITSLQELYHMNEWFGQQDFDYKICIAGNHDTHLERIDKKQCKQLFTNAIYLENDYLEIEGLKIYGSPYTPEFNNWSFMYQRRSKEANDLWKQIPDNLDLLISHGPPYQILDKNQNNENCGCEVLQREVFIKMPKRHLFGHIHGYGHQYIEKERIKFYNTSVLDETYKLTHKITEIEI